MIPRARWEIHNSCLIEDFERAQALFRRVQEIEPAISAMNCARQGEFHLLRATSADPDDIGSAAFRLAAPATALATTLARWAVAVDVDEGQDEASITEARYWFEKAVKGGVSLPQHHACALARCFFIEKNYQRAAVLFEASLGMGGIGLEGEQAALNDELNAALHLAVARSHELAGEPTKARDVLTRCVDTFPKYGSGYRRSAELAITLDADYRKAYEVLVRWSEVEPQLVSDIWVRTLRGLGGIKADQPIERMLDEFFDAHPKRLKWVNCAVKIHWSTFERLGDKAQKQWLYGCWILWWRPPGFEAIDYAAGATHFARALESELRGRVFARFLESLPDVTVLKTDWAANRPNARGKSAWKRILDGNGGLGDMLTECDPYRNSDLVASKMFREWLGASVPMLASQYDKNEAGQINNVRTRSTHLGEEARERAEEVCALCRKYLEYILGRDA